MHCFEKLWYIEARADSNKSSSEKPCESLARWTAAMTDRVNLDLVLQAETMFTVGPGRWGPDMWQEQMFVTVALSKHLTRGTPDKPHRLLSICCLWGNDSQSRGLEGPRRYQCDTIRGAQHLPLLGVLGVPHWDTLTATLTATWSRKY